MKEIDGVSRREFLQYVTISGIAVPVFGVTAFHGEAHASTVKILDGVDLDDLGKQHLPNVTLPPVVEDGRQAPVVVRMDHPMDADHYIKSIQVLNFADPVVVKGEFYFTPANGEAFFGTQIRLAGGEGKVWVVAECNNHGRFAVSRSVKVAAGGC